MSTVEISGFSNKHIWATKIHHGSGLPCRTIVPRMFPHKLLLFSVQITTDFSNEEKYIKMDAQIGPPFERIRRDFTFLFFTV